MLPKNYLAKLGLVLWWSADFNQRHIKAVGRQKDLFPMPVDDSERNASLCENPQASLFLRVDHFHEHIYFDVTTCHKL